MRKGLFSPRRFRPRDGLTRVEQRLPPSRQRPQHRTAARPAGPRAPELPRGQMEKSREENRRGGGPETQMFPSDGER